MAQQAIRVAILGAGWPGVKHAEAYKAAGGFDVVAVADRIPGRRKAILQTFPSAREYADANDAVRDVGVDAVSICLPNDLHALVALAALKAGKHAVCETPFTTNAGDSKRIAAAAGKAGKVVLCAAQRRFGGAEQAADQAIAKGYAGDVYHARASWMRTRGIPAGTGWFTDKSKSGGGAMIDLGVQMLDLAWHLLGQPAPLTAYAVAHRRFVELIPEGTTFDVEDAGFALVRFAGGKSLELSASWAINQAPRHQGTACRMYGDEGAIEVYTPQGPLLFRNFGDKGEAKESPLKLPKLMHYPAMMRHFRHCITTGQTPAPSAEDGLVVMRMIDAIYKSIETGRSAEVRSDPAPASASGVAPATGAVSAEGE
jgi:predicted dehydrogenase